MKPVKNAWRIVCVREIASKITDKVFVSSTILTVVLIVASILIPFWMNSNNKTNEYSLGLMSGSQGQQIAQAAQDQLELAGAGLSLRTQTFASEQEAQSALEEGEVDAYFAPRQQGWELVFEQDVSQNLFNLMQQASTSYTLAANAQEQGVDLARLTAGSQLSSRVIQEDTQAQAAARILGIVFATLFYLTSLTVGQLISMSVVEEKQNRIVEIIASAIPVRQLLLGKVVGNIVLFIGQLLLYVLTGLGLAYSLGILTDFSWLFVDIGWFLAFYIFGFTALAVIWAAVGAMASRMEDLGSLSMPLMIITLAALVLGLWSKGTVLVISSFVPIISSIAMPLRLLEEELPLWQPCLSLALTLLAVYLLTILGAKIYSRNIMRSGSAVSWRQSLKGS
ncbi:MAG: ABC transporter permease [Rothia sp. (in: high G+C Gram-positive bacteria)]|nr:ABC transporter permease [Rothia sp. (in: high G+C Gram-positive bacteria)]